MHGSSGILSIPQVRDAVFKTNLWMALPYFVQLGNVCPTAHVATDILAAMRKETLYQSRSQKAGCAGNEYLHANRAG
jgi:hypothetical protein